MADVDAVLFDLDRTLCAYRRSTGDLLSLAFADVGVDPFFEAAEYWERADEFAEATDDIAELRRACFAALAEERGRDPELGEAVADAFAAERDHANVRPLPGAAESVESLAADHRLAVLTNGAPGMQGEKLSALPFAGAFETVVHGGYDAPGKPDPAPFHETLDRLGVPPARAVHVGDSLDSDVAGAHAAGLRSAWLADDDADGRDTGPTPHYRLDSLADLVPPPWA